MKLYAIRHGQTYMNINGNLNGQLDDDLTKAGIEQARQAAALVPASVKRLYASPLQRARKTAELLNIHQLPLSLHDELMEVNFGVLNGAPFTDEIKARHIAMDYDWRPSGECLDDVKARVLSILQKIKAENGDGEAMIVTHGGIIRMLYHLQNGEQFDLIENASLHTFDLDKIL